MSLKSLVWVLGIVLVAVFVGAGYFLVERPAGGEGLDLKIEVPETVSIGTPFDAKVVVSNASRNVLSRAELSLKLPPDFISVKSGPEKSIETRDLGTVGAGSVTEETFTLLVLQGENTIQELEATVSYAPTPSGRRFEKKKTAPLEIGSPSLLVDIEMPQKVFSGDEFELILSYRNSSESRFLNARLRARYPAQFSFKEASLKPDQGSGLWDLGNLEPGSEDKITVKGSMAGVENAAFEFAAELEADFFGNSYVINRKTGRVEIARSPLSLSILANNDPNTIAAPGGQLTYTLRYANNTDIGLRDVVIKARLTGEMFDIASVSTNGFLSGEEPNTVVWTAARIPELALLPPGEDGNVNFSVMLKREYPIRRLSDKNFLLKVKGEIESPTVPEFIAAERTMGLAETETKVKGSFRGEVKTFFWDAVSGIVNDGPLPPRVGQPTQFTVHWVLTNYSTDLRDLEMRAFLGPNVQFTGVVKSNADALPLFNNRTQEITWSVPKVRAGRGILDEPLEAIFQVELTPSVVQAGSYPLLLNPTTVKAVDDFTGVALEGQLSRVTTQLEYDAKARDQGRVLAE